MLCGYRVIYPSVNVAASNVPIYSPPCVCVELLGEPFERCPFCGGSGSPEP